MVRELATYEKELDQVESTAESFTRLMFPADGSAPPRDLTAVFTTDVPNYADVSAGDGYAWCAGEAACMAALRRELVDVKGHPRESIRAAAYWKRGATGHHENLEG